uniref:Calx-beta domain-containing protein n=1 Tax=Trichobilharzia regenti TaxID=157069 RepID=A0AA85JW88_TRIRE|nr:unnamed protein product [Trichobilharzia regenti]
MTDNRSFEHSADITNTQSVNAENRRKIQPSEFELRMGRRGSESVVRRKLMSEQRRTFSRGSLFRFLHKDLNRLSGFSNYKRRQTITSDETQQGHYNEGKVFFDAHTYTVHYGIEEVILSVIYLRSYSSRDFHDKVSRESLFENIQHEAVIEENTSKESTSPNEEISEVNNINGSKHDLMDKESLTVFFEVRPGTALPGLHYMPTPKGYIHFGKADTERQITVKLNANITEEYTREQKLEIISKGNTHFSVASPNDLGNPSVARVLLVPEEAISHFELQSSHYYPNPKTPTISVVIIRQRNCELEETIHVVTRDGNAKGWKEDHCQSGDYEAIDENVLFNIGEKRKAIEIKIKPDRESQKYFFVELHDSENKTKIGNHTEAICFIRPIEIIEDNDSEIGWIEQFRMAVSLLPNYNENGDQIPSTIAQYMVHAVTIVWKLICAFLPPRKYLGAYPTFITSLILIGLQTALVEELSNLLGCTAGIKTAVTGISLVALGTSLPDVFVSRTAAICDKNADNSIGNITGSNSVNVFLGVGLPWLISAINAKVKGKQYCISSENILEAISFYLICAFLCLGMLIIRRKIYDGELGGPMCAKLISGISLILLWITYVLLLSLESYDVINWGLVRKQSTCL